MVPGGSIRARASFHLHHNRFAPPPYGALSCLSRCRRRQCDGTGFCFLLVVIFLGSSVVEDDHSPMGGSDDAVSRYIYSLIASTARDTATLAEFTIDGYI